MKKWAWIRVIYRCNIDQTTPWPFNWSEGDNSFLLAANIISSDDIMKTLATITIEIGNNTTNQSFRENLSVCGVSWPLGLI